MCLRQFQDQISGFVNWRCRAVAGVNTAWPDQLRQRQMPGVNPHAGSLFAKRLLLGVGRRFVPSMGVWGLAPSINLAYCHKHIQNLKLPVTLLRIYTKQNPANIAGPQNHKF
jgi:hypothetical protein